MLKSLLYSPQGPEPDDHYWQAPTFPIDIFHLQRVPPRPRHLMGAVIHVTVAVGAIS